MNSKCRVRIARGDFAELQRWLFPGDHDEHGAVLLAGTARENGVLTLLVREIHLAREGVDYVEGQIGYRALHPAFIHRLITRARDERLAYLAVHNHHSDQSVTFSDIDIQSHERGYPALLQIARGMPVGALVFGDRSVQADVWSADGNRAELDELVIVGQTINRMTPHPRSLTTVVAEPAFDRQIRMFGRSGQEALARCHVGILGLGGVGSLVAEYLGRLGVGQFTLIDPDVVEESNLSRIVGASAADAVQRTQKVEVARRLIIEANTAATIHTIPDDAAKGSVAETLIGVDYLFLAADSMRARLVFNALVHQYLIPGVQLGSKIRSDMQGRIVDVMSANRPVRPGHACLWCNQLIDPTALAQEAKTDSERREQAYGVQEPNPSVIALNAVAAAHAVNDFMLDYLSLRKEPEAVRYEHFGFLNHGRTLVQPRRDENCPECSPHGRRYGRGDTMPLPCIEG